MGNHMQGIYKAAQQASSINSEAVTIAIANKKSTNATHIADRIIDKIAQLKGGLIPAQVEITTTRNYGDTAKEKSDELLEHMLIAAFSVTILVALALGFREKSIFEQLIGIATLNRN